MDPTALPSLVSPDQIWILLACVVSGVAVSIHLEQTYRWAVRLSGPVLALGIAMVLTNLKVVPSPEGWRRLLPLEAGTYDLIDAFLVPLAIPLLLFKANLGRIVRETGQMFLAFHVAAFGTLLGAAAAFLIFRHHVALPAELIGIMTGSYIGGGVNFMAVKNSFNVPSELSNPLIVADNVIMAGMFVLLLLLAGTRWFLERYTHPHTLEASAAGAGTQAARYWQRKPISLLDMARALAVALVIVAAAHGMERWMARGLPEGLLQSFLGNKFVWITGLTVALATLAHGWLERIHGAEEIGTFLLYLFFFVIGLRADVFEVLSNVPQLFLLCLVMAATNLVVTLCLGKLLRLPLEELLLCVNATLGGAPSAAAMAVSKGWTKLVLPGLLVGIWGYVIGTFLGVFTVEALRRLFPP